MGDPVFKSAVELAQMIRDRHISAIELLNAHLEYIAKHNPKLNAICTFDEENARIKAKQADEALARGENWGALHGGVHPSLARLSLRTVHSNKHNDGAELEEHFPLSTVPRKA